MDIHFHKNYIRIEKEHWVMKVRRMMVHDSLDEYLTKKPQDTKILDFGCGSGLVIEEFQKRGFNCYGIDVSADAIRFGVSKGIKNLSIIDSDKINFPDGTFDAVFALDVLEHIENEVPVLKEIERVLKPGGLFIVQVPAYMFLWGVQDVVAHHYRRYTEQNLSKVIHDSTLLQDVRSTYFNTLLFLPILIVRWFTKITGWKRRESDFDINSQFLNNIFFSIFNYERTLLKKINFPFGVSILMVLRKK
jgi:2-polyprenyl-3-methyl-5-hydroxy-6-metoxy-1,4-benzoquinol methylase